MTYIIDIILIAVFLFVVLISAKKGLIKSLFDLIGTIIAYILAKIFAEYTAPVIYSRYIEQKAADYLTKSLGNVGTTDYVEQVKTALSSIPDSFNGVLQILGFDEAVLIEKVSSAQMNGNNLIETVLNSVVEPVATAIVQLIIFAISAVLIGIVLKIIVKLLDKVVKKIPVVKRFNTVFGAVFGVLRGVLIVVVISMLLIFVASFVNNETFIENVNNSNILELVKNFITSISGLNF